MQVGNKVKVKGTTKPIMTIDKINTRLLEIYDCEYIDIITSVECIWFNDNQELFKHKFNDGVLEVIDE